jgi:hypothetical protein
MPKTSKKSIMGVVDLLNAYMIGFLESQLSRHKERLEKLEKAWNSDDTQSEVKDLVGQMLAIAPKQKPIKDPDAPVKGMSNYLFFSRDNREEIKAEFPDLSNSALTSKIAERWNELKLSTNKNDKKKLNKYNDMAAEAKAEYERQMAEYVKPPLEDIMEKVRLLEEKKSEERKANRKPRDKKAKDAPVNPRSIYQIFAKEWREQRKIEHPDWNKEKCTKKLAEAWKAIEEGSPEALEYKRLHEEDKLRWNREMEEYKAKNQPSSAAKKKAVSSSRKKPLKEIPVEEEEEESDEDVEIQVPKLEPESEEEDDE